MESVMTRSGEPVVLASGAVLEISGPETSSMILASSGALLIAADGGTIRESDIDGGVALIQSGGRMETSIVRNNGLAIVSSGATATELTIGSDGRLQVASAASLVQTTVTSGGRLTVLGGATITSLTMEDGTSLDLTLNSDTVLQGTCGGTALDISNGLAEGLTLRDSASQLTLTDGGQARNLAVDSGAQVDVYDGGTLSGAVFSRRAELTMSGGQATDIAIQSAATLYLDAGNVSSLALGGLAFVSRGAKLRDADVVSGGRLLVYTGADVSGARVQSGGQLRLYNQATVSGVALASGGSLQVGPSATATGTVNGGLVTLSNGACLHVRDGKFNAALRTSGMAKVAAFGNLDVTFDLTDRQPSDAILIDDISVFQADTISYSIVATPDLSSGHYRLANQADAFDVLAIACGDFHGTLRPEQTLECQDDLLFFLNQGKTGELVLTIANFPELATHKTTLAWNETDTCTLTLANANGNALSLAVAGGALDCYQTPSNLSWKSMHGATVVKDTTAMEAPAADSAPALLYSIADGTDDLFFASADGVWDGGYCARHQGNPNWNGTGQAARLADRNRISTVVWGSEDAGILCLTDDANGDAFFLEDFHTESFANLAKDAPRWRNLKEIRGGGGDDVIDLTSHQFTAPSMTLRGGDGDDIMWANAGQNLLFGDEGNDILCGADGDDILCGGGGDDAIQGCGGNDIVCFGKNWGHDTVSQDSGSLTLWFDGIKEGDLARGTDSQGQTVLSHGGNSVTLRLAEQVEFSLVFSKNQTANGIAGADLEQVGAFLASTSRQIFTAQLAG